MTKKQAMAKDRVITQKSLRRWLKLEKEQLAIANAQASLADDVAKRLICGAKVQPGALFCRLKTGWHTDGITATMHIWEPDGD